MKTILITGITGYLGKRLSSAILKQGFNIIGLTPSKSDSIPQNSALKLYYLDETPLEEVFKSNRIDGIIHLATLYGRKGESAADMAKVNIIFPLELMVAAAKYKTSFFINTDTILTPALNPYALTKHQTKQWLDMFNNEFAAVNLRLDHFYGPQDSDVKFIAYLLKQLKAEVKSIPLTPGDQTRDFIYIDDVISAYITVINAALDGKFDLDKTHNFEVGTGVKTTIKELVLTLKKLLNNQTTVLNFGAVPYRKNEVLNYDIDTAPLKALGWQAKTMLLQGLKQTIKEEEF